MLFFIQCPLDWISSFRLIQIHLMLFFISVVFEISATPANSNTSHVILYHNRNIAGMRRKWFKYISCYSLSTLPTSPCHFTLGFKYISCYSLSLAVSVLAVSVLAFKYISCYSLSIAFLSTIRGDLKFKYISCYSLSSLQSTVTTSFAHSNTSHVILYRCPLTAICISETDSNTSHVILYPHAFPPFPTLLYLKPPYISIFYHFLPAVSVFLPNSLFLPHIPCIFGILSNFPLFIAW